MKVSCCQNRLLITRQIFTMRFLTMRIFWATNIIRSYAYRKSREPLRYVQFLVDVETKKSNLWQNSFPVIKKPLECSVYCRSQSQPLRTAVSVPADAERLPTLLLILVQVSTDWNPCVSILWPLEFKCFDVLAYQSIVLAQGRLNK